MSQGEILLVEDEPKLAALVGDYLRAAGYDVAHLADGNAVIPALRGKAYDLLLLDLMLPGRDGLDICRELRGFSRMPLIMMTARVEEIDRLLGLELGADDYICKPFSPASWWRGSRPCCGAAAPRRRTRAWNWTRGPSRRATWAWRWTSPRWSSACSPPWPHAPARCCPATS